LPPSNPTEQFIAGALIVITRLVIILMLNRLVPTQVFGLGEVGNLSGVSQLSGNSCVLESGAVYCWWGGGRTPIQVPGVAELVICLA